MSTLVCMNISNLMNTSKTSFPEKFLFLQILVTSNDPVKCGMLHLLIMEFRNSSEQWGFFVGLVET